MDREALRRLQQLYRTGKINLEEYRRRLEQIATAQLNKDTWFLSPNLIIGHFKLVQCLGKGGMSEVWRAIDLDCEKLFHHPSKDCDFALKFLPPQLQDQEAHNILKRESFIFHRLRNCPHIIKSFGHYEIKIEQQKYIFLVLEYLKGRSLKQYLKQEWQRGIPLQAVFKLIDPVVDALNCAHHNEVIHRDIKPGNIMLLDDGSVKLLDFGIADEIRRTSTYMQNPSLVSAYETPLYSAPEATTSTAKSTLDIHALACVIYELLTGRPPFYSSTSLPREPNVLPPKPSTLNDAAWQVLCSGFAFYPEQRPAKVIDFIVEFKKASQSVPPTVIIPPDKNPYRVKQKEEEKINSKKRTSNPIVSNKAWLGIVLSTLILCFGLWWLWQEKIRLDQVDQSLYQRAKEQNHIEAWQTYLNACQQQGTDCRYRVEAETAVKNLNACMQVDCNDQQIQQTQSNYKSHLCQGQGCQSQNKIDQEQQQYQRALLSNQWQDWQDYLQNCSICTYRNQAQKVIEQIQTQYRQAWQLYFDQAQYSAALQNLQKAAQQGHVLAMGLLAIQYASGHGIQKDLKKAEAWWQKARQSMPQNQEAQFITALVQLYLERNDRQAKNILEKLAQNGFVPAMYYNGWLYKNGLGTPQNKQLALQWYQKAAHLNYPKAMNALALLYQQGKVLPKDNQQAFYWLKKAAQSGYVIAMYNLGIFEQKNKNIQQAIFWYQKAAEGDYVPAMYALALMYQKKSFDQQALIWYQKAAESGHVKAMVKLAYLYQNGQYMPQNIQKAIYWYQQAAAQGESEAISALEKIYKQQ